ncbi:hypothetical protein NMY3_00563 [Candidatus Nitrosocosmicus oleophilus]|uniref:DUF1802 family protein n=1 Tax=Candidatus Nitrosocosmicus oleophilus TaxID=1353260 RepID=A0A654LTS4_9ARCH|nr:DUF1802 family protein [Candidatus Nitrosocosmicus oleophilus]ALI34774.1 hypothetical protein NMY3_00563 [Candidatus Nitrosocosmicus oleophilus]
MISNSFLDNGFNDIVSFNSKTMPLKRFGHDSERTHSAISSDTATATQVNNTQESFNDESNSSTNTFGALKEWAIVCKALESGNQILSFRKGGIMEFRNGFELKFKNFFLSPTFEHQAKESIRMDYHTTLDELNRKNGLDNAETRPDSNKTTEIASFVEITHFSEVPNLTTLKKLENFHIWTDDYLKSRFDYNPKKPLYLLLLRVYKLNKPIKLVNKPEWVGCKSWIQIDSHDPDLITYFENHLPEKPFEYLKSISKPCIDDDNFNKLSEKVRSIV